MCYPKMGVHLLSTLIITTMFIINRLSFFTVFLTVVISSTFVSCSSSLAHKDVAPSNSYTNKLVSGPWLMNSVVTTQNTEIFDLYSEMDDREKDNALIFSENFTVFADEGETKYSENDPQIIEKGNWTISNDGKVLQIEEYGMVSELQIVKLTNTELKLRAIDYDSTTNTSMSLTICYNH